MSDAALSALAAAVQAAPENAPLRLHYASLLLAAGRSLGAIEHASAALRLDPSSTEAIDVLQRAAAAVSAGTPATSAPIPSTPTPSTPTPSTPTASTPTPGAPTADYPIGPPPPSAETPPPASSPPQASSPPPAPGVDWARLENEVGVSFPPPFVESPPAPPGPAEADAPGLDADRPDGAGPAPASGQQFLVPARDDTPDDASDLLEVSRESITLADVGGLEPVKKRIREAFLEPMRNQAIAKAFGKSLRGGLLLYGPPGTGKTFMARAVAGELGARFLTVTLADILDKYMGESEQNLHALFQKARQLAPAVLFLDEVDAIGGKRAQYSGSSGMRTVVNQLLQEMDGIGSDNDGLFILGATNHPWDVDTALLRPGRFDRVVLVLPPDEPAREAILRHHLAGRPVAGIDLRRIVAQTDGFSGADLEHLAATAAEKAMMDSIATGQVRPITMDDVRAALTEIRPSTTAWLQSARNVVTFANNDGRYDDLAAYLRARRML
ncbi:ATP-binding protein [Cellulosimicrobium terreum]|nr:ATP-binding protein [Cellulosimicrobium terreum]